MSSYVSSGKLAGDAIGRHAPPDRQELVDANRMTVVSFGHLKHPHRPIAARLLPGAVTTTPKTSFSKSGDAGIMAIT